MGMGSSSASFGVSQLLRPFTPDQLQENYCQSNTKFKLILLKQRKYHYEVPKYSKYNPTGPRK